FRVASGQHNPNETATKDRHRAPFRFITKERRSPGRKWISRGGTHGLKAIHRLARKANQGPGSLFPRRKGTRPLVQIGTSPGGYFPKRRRKTPLSLVLRVSSAGRAAGLGISCVGLEAGAAPRRLIASWARRCRGA